MDTACLQYRLTSAERETFDRDGYFIIEDAIPLEMVERLTVALDRIDAEERAANGLTPYDKQNILDFIGRDKVFLEPLDWPTTFAKVWDILGWNIQLYHSHTIISPPPAPGSPPESGRLNWHQDSGRLNRELETNPQPRISLKIAYFLTDCSVPGRANLYVVPGSHRQNELPKSSNGSSDPVGGEPVLVRPGTAVVFDRRIWHASSPNHADFARKVLFYGYSYRWLRPRDNMTVEHYLDSCTPIQQQLLCVSHSGGHGYSSPQDNDVPLRGWIEGHLGEEAVMA